MLYVVWTSGARVDIDEGIRPSDMSTNLLYSVPLKSVPPGLHAIPTKIYYQLNEADDGKTSTTAQP
jgi:hypothetical protein